MRVFSRLLLVTAFLLSLLLIPATSEAGPTDPECLFPSAHERFGVTTGQDIDGYQVATLNAGGYLDWRANNNPSHPNGMYYYPMVHTWEDGYWPSGAALEQIVRANPEALWLIGNEGETIWMDNTTPERYAEHFHDIHAAITALDPKASFAFSGLATVSTLRLAWLDRAWTAYRSMYGVDMPIDVWNIHTYMVNEMHLEWGAEVPAGIDNAVGYTGDHWAEAVVSGASGGTVHQSRVRGARAYFGFHGPQVTIHLRTGPDSGQAAIYLDRDASPVETVNLYAASPGTLSRTYSGLLPSSSSRVGDRHNIRVDVTGNQDPRSSGFWIRVDAVEAASTTSLPGGRLEDNNPLRARIVTDVNDHDNLNLIAQQIRDFRQWMANHGQRNKPLINTELGILMTEDLGFDYPRVRRFMLDSFDLFLNDLRDPQLGYPLDDNRLLQQWFWFDLALDTFEGRTVHTGLFDRATGQIKPLGIDFGNYVTPLETDYSDLKVVSLDLTPTWTLFAGDPSLVQADAILRNWGNAASGPFDAQLTVNAQSSHTWSVDNLAPRYSVGDTIQLSTQWQSILSSNRTASVTADGSQQVNDPCRGNNTISTTLVVPSFTDLAISNLHTVPRVFPTIPPGQRVVVPLRATLTNLGGVGTAAAQITVNFWHGDPDAGGTLIGSQILRRGQTALPAIVHFEWADRGPGIYEVWVDVVPVAEETNLQNNRQHIQVFVPVSIAYLPVMQRRAWLDSPVDPKLPPAEATWPAYRLPMLP